MSRRDRRHRPGRAAVAAEREPTRIPGEGRIELEPSAGNLQLQRPELPSIPLPSVLKRGPGKQKAEGRREEAAERGRHRPGEVAPVSGVYDLVDENGAYLDLQIACHAGKRLPPVPSERTIRRARREMRHDSEATVDRDRCEYELAYQAIHLAPEDEPLSFPPTVHLPGDTAPVSGIYDVVDEDGRYVYYQRSLVEGDEFDPLEDPVAHGYTLAFPAKHLHHGLRPA